MPKMTEDKLNELGDKIQMDPGRTVFFYVHHDSSPVGQLEIANDGHIIDANDTQTEMPDVWYSERYTSTSKDKKADETLWFSPLDYLVEVATQLASCQIHEIFEWLRLENIRVIPPHLSEQMDWTEQQMRSFMKKTFRLFMNEECRQFLESFTKK